MEKWLIILTTLVTFNYTGSTLQQVHILFRHGERSPTEIYPNDPHNNVTWPNGLGQLSNVGKRQMYSLGTLLREEYNNFLGPYYNSKEIIMYTSYADRCHMSGQLLFAGLFPPKDVQIWNDNLLWQPIPIHEFLRHEDNKIAMKKPCPNYDKALKDIYKSEKIKEVNEKNKELYEYLTKHTGSEINNILSLEFLYNILEIEAINNLTLPDWTKGVYPDKMKDLAALSLAVFADDTLMKRLHGGPLLKEIIDNMKNKQKDTSEKKMVLYSGHDVTLVTLLRTLGFDELIKPEFGASVTIELHLKEDYYVQFFYRDNAFSNKKELLLNNCQNLACKLGEVEDILKEVIPIDWEKECLA